jgi:hypothetical protein
MTLPVVIPPVPVSALALAAGRSEATEALRSASRALAGDADEVRAVAASVALAAGLDWRGPAAGAFRDAVTDRIGAVRVAAVLVDDLAAALRAAAGASA